MADSTYIPGLAVRAARTADAPRHTAMVRVAHWMTAVSFFALVVSGIGILLSHPRFYWGETGGKGGPSLFDLPLPTMLGGPSGWGRYMHFQAAWLCVLTGIPYLIWGFTRRHFQRNLTQPGALNYNPRQRATYLIVIFVLFPLIIWTGLAMSPALTSLFPVLVNAFGGHQSARTIHFFLGVALFLFVLVHIVMVWRAGFRKLVGPMITGRVKERS